ncbi:MAG: pyridoxine 5'-phosphate synthase [Bacteroidales bacterium]|jgi:pyridoxine 5-phosphate synthase|nr:pyridoxine 5'-phosphate synthase [Bacteroidales bacterium]
MSCRLSVNINKIATLRNARGHDLPNVVQVARDCETFGAQGITVHPRPDERHIRYQDVLDLAGIVTTELNIEGYPSQRFIDLALLVKPTQVTLVPDKPDAITSDAGWNTVKHASFLKEVVQTLNSSGIRTSIFTDPDLQMIEHAALCDCQRIELYTEKYARHSNPVQAIAPYVEAACRATSLGLEVNAGHDLNLINLPYFHRTIPCLKEVSIGHALICDALYYGLQNTIQLYLKCLQ